MRGLRSFFGLLAILIALGAYLYFVESTREAGSSSREKVFTVQADGIEEISIRSEAGERTTLRKTGSDWQIVAPIEAKPDGVEVSGLTTNLSNVEVQDVIDENPADLAEYGLAEPRFEVAFKADGEERRLQIGRKTPPGTDLYAKLDGQTRVFLIASYLESTFNRNTFELRDKSVMTIDRGSVDTLAVSTPARTLRFRKADAEWQMIEPVKARADFTSVDGLVSRVNTLQMKSIAADDSSDLTEYGLDKPAATVQLGSGSSQATLLVGKTAAEGTIYAKDQSRPLVVTIDSSLMDDLKKEVADFRQKDLFDARAFNATRIEITRGAETMAWEKTTQKNKEGQDEEKWRPVAPASGDVDQTKLENLLSTATLARATGFVDSTGKAGAPELTVTIKSDQGKREEKVAFSRSGTSAYAVRAGEPGAATVESSTLDNLAKAIDELKAPSKSDQQ